MRFAPRAFVLVVTLVTAMTAAAPVVRADEEHRPVTLGSTSSTSTISLEQAVKMAEQKYKARVVRAESEDENGKTVYVLRLLNDSGRVWTVRVDAATGTVT